MIHPACTWVDEHGEAKVEGKDRAIAGSFINSEKRDVKVVKDDMKRVVSRYGSPFRDIPTLLRGNGRVVGRGRAIIDHGRLRSR